ncbi:PRE_C2HC domain-containing protein [Trichonephila clavipes]|nr:PRE_C2HC domain-containing protein [Trichonephila clavipes]
MDPQMVDYAKMMEQAKDDGWRRVRTQIVCFSDRRNIPDRGSRDDERQTLYLEHRIRSEKEFSDLTDADALVKFQNEHDELSSQKEHILAKLAGKYLKIFCKTSDEHRVVTDHLREIKEQFYVIDPPDSRPLKVVIKGLPISTEIHEIQDDLTSQGFNVEKVAQLTRSKTKAPLPIFMVELEKKPNSPDIFKLKNAATLRCK